MLARAGVTGPHGSDSVSADVLPEEQWEIYRAVIREARRRGIRFALGGAFGFGVYTGHWRNTKDFDLYVRPEDREAMIEVFDDSGLEDYYGAVPYDRGWIYRGHRGGIIVDVIWAMANQRAQVDNDWFAAARRTVLRGEPLDVIPPEEMVWQKLYIIQRERCDWPDVLNLFYAMGPGIDWRRLLSRLGADRPLLAGALSLFGWLCPGHARALPAWLWDQVKIGPPDIAGAAFEAARAALLDSRPWFAPSNGAR